ncbi:hypothetical protein ADT71_12465 [Novosphingobium sp. ST904]|nr:hypothetical protein ADT71_12465 [Novosphingobium sp. ST904]
MPLSNAAGGTAGLRAIGFSPPLGETFPPVSEIIWARGDFSETSDFSKTSDFSTAPNFADL